MKCKYESRERQVSTDGGVTWATVEVIKGDLIETESPDCPDDAYIDRWVTLEGAYLCDGTNKYKKEVYQISHNGGLSWYNTIPAVYKLGDFVGVDSNFCDNKFEGHYILTPIRDYSGGGGSQWHPRYYIDPIKIIKCEEDSSELTGDEVSYYNNVTIEGTSYSGTLTSCTIGNCVSSIGTGAFRRTELSSIEIPDSVVSIGDRCFEEAKNLTNFSFKGQHIGILAFRSCPSLTSVTIDYATSIGNRAFENCSGLTSINLPSITSLGRGCFENISSLREVNIGKYLTNVDVLPFYHSPITSLTFNSKTIADWFLAQSTLVTVNLGSNVETISDETFKNYSGLTSIYLPDSIKYIGKNAFQNCTSLTSIRIPTYYTMELKDYVFSNCRSITSVEIRDNITKIGDRAFNECSSLSSVTVLATTPPTLGNYAFYNTNNCPIYVPQQSVEAYKTASGWSTYTDRIFAIQS